MTATATDSGHSDITSADTYVQGVPHATFRRLRDQDPVSWWEEHDGGSGFWAITRYQDVIDVSRDPETFCSRHGVRLEEMTPEENEARRSMIEMDAPEHTQYRRLVSKPFARYNVMTYEEAIREIARDVIAGARQAGTSFCFVERIAKQLPMRMLGKLLGVPDEDGPWLVEKGDALLGNADPDFTDYPVDLVDTSDFRLLPFRSPAGLDLFHYAQKQATTRRGCPGTDVISRLLEPMGDGEQLTEQAFNSFFTLLVAAGNDTTRYTMAAGMQALMEHPGAMAELRDHPELLNSATEEILRWASVAMHFRRTATKDTELHGRRIREGQKLVMWFVSANFDERQFADPFSFDIRRHPNEQAAFGRMSPHLCLGAHLARMEIRVLLEELLPAVADIRAAGPIERLRSNFISGIKRLPVEVTWA